MRNLTLDRDTADRLLEGRVDPDDAPPAYAEVAALFRAVARTGTVDQARERAAVAAMSELVRADTAALPAAAPRGTRRRRGTRVRLAAVLVGAMLVGTAGLAVAGELPPAAQGFAHDLLAKIGIEVPRPTEPRLPDPAVASDVAPSVQAPDEPRGESDEPHGQADEPHGQADEPHGQADEPHGQADEPHGQADEPHGQADEPHGQADEPHGQADEPHGPPTENGRS